ncbi:MAG TPA: DUF3224 domain-containing protein [Acidimicrobiia bacterium]|nr:DUF3224 domain-containing protein [Acidimicrobiia bacterium]
MEAHATFELSDQRQLPTADDVASVVGVDLSHSAFTKTFRGELEGSSVTQMLAARSPGGAGYVAMERIVGQLGDRVGTFVLLHVGTLDASGEPTGHWTIVPGSGTGELAGISGHAHIGADDDTHRIQLHYELDGTTPPADRP